MVELATPLGMNKSGGRDTVSTITSGVCDTFFRRPTSFRTHQQANSIGLRRQRQRSCLQTTIETKDAGRDPLLKSKIDDERLQHELRSKSSEDNALKIEILTGLKNLRRLEYLRHLQTSSWMVWSIGTIGSRKRPLRMQRILVCPLILSWLELLRRAIATRSPEEAMKSGAIGDRRSTNNSAWESRKVHNSLWAKRRRRLPRQVGFRRCWNSCLVTDASRNPTCRDRLPSARDACPHHSGPTA